jgi:hypothetical protein
MSRYFQKQTRNLGSDRNGLNVGYRKERIAVIMVWGRANIAEDAQSGHATFQCDKTRKALDRLSGGVKSLL